MTKQEFINDAKKGVGLEIIPYEDLHLYRIQINSPTGRSETAFLNAKDYVDKQWELYEEALKNVNTEEVVVPELQKPDYNSLVENAIKTLEIDKMKYFDVAVNGNTFTVVIYDSGAEAITQQINYIKKHWTFVNERPRNMLSGLEHIISFYQFDNWIRTVAKPTDDLSKYENIASRLDTVFDGIKLEGFDD